MVTQPHVRQVVSFGEFELDVRTGELRRAGSVLRLQPQPAKVLTILVSRAGEIVTRDELSQQVWGSDTYVDFEHGLNFAIRQIRSALQDNAESSRYLETIPKRGYRFIAHVNDVAQAPPPLAETTPVGAPRRSTVRMLTILLAAALLASGFWIVSGKWRRSAPNRKISSLAVLPLRNLSGDSDQEYFSEGVTDELITDLAKTTRLRVISHTSVERYKNPTETLPQIARELGVDAIVEGTIMRAGTRVRITAQLIDARRDQHIWADSYERDLSDVLELQGDVAKQIAKEIGIQLSSNDETRLSRTERSVDPSAHEAYLKGVFFFDLASCRDFENALTYFQQSITRDPSFAPAYAGMADAYFSIGDWRCWHVPAFEKAQAMASKAIELEPSNARAHAVLAKVGFARDWNRVGPAQQFTTALDLDPNDASIHSYYGSFLVAIGEQEAGLAEERKAQELDPLSEKTNDNYTWTLYLAHRFDAAIEVAKHSLSVSPAYGQYYWLGQCYERKGLPDQAMEYYLKAFSGLPAELSLRRAAFQKNGLKGYWQEDERLRRRRQEEVDAVYEAMYYAHEGENDKAIEQLQIAYQQHSDGLQYLKIEPVYDGLRDDPRFKDLIAKVGL